MPYNGPTSLCSLLIKNSVVQISPAFYGPTQTLLPSIQRCCESAALNMPANLENLAVATGLKKVSFHSNSKERQCQRMLKLPHNCTRLTR